MRIACRNRRTVIHRFNSAKLSSTINLILRKHSSPAATETAATVNWYHVEPFPSRVRLGAEESSVSSSCLILELPYLFPHLFPHLKPFPFFADFAYLHLPLSMGPRGVENKRKKKKKMNYKGRRVDKMEWIKFVSLANALGLQNSRHTPTKLIISNWEPEFSAKHWPYEVQAMG